MATLSDMIFILRQNYQKSTLLARYSVLYHAKTIARLLILTAKKVHP
jgi:hypothetical protein